MSTDEIRVMFLNSWGESHEDILERYSQQTPNCSGIWENVKGVSNINEADFYIMLQNETSEYREIPESKKIYLQREPHYIQSRSWLNNPKDNQFTYDRCYHAATWWVNKTFDELVQLQYPDKQQLASTIVSAKSSTRGHKQRLNFIYNYIKQSSDLDVYGSNHPQINNCIKGHIKGKYDGLIDYKFSLACENGNINNYFTEKIQDCFLTWTIPIYFGCPNIDSFFPGDSFYTLDITKSGCGSRLKEILNIPIEQKNIDALKEARELVLYKYNIWPTVKRIIETGRVI